MFEDMLGARVIDFGRHWNKFLPLCQLSYNNSYDLRIDIKPFEALYGRGFKSPICLFKSRDVKLLGVDLVKDTQDKARNIKTKILATRSRQRVCISQ